MGGGWVLVCCFGVVFRKNGGGGGGGSQRSNLDQFVDWQELILYEYMACDGRGVRSKTAGGQKNRIILNKSQILHYVSCV